MKFLTVFSTFPKRAPGRLGIFSPSVAQPGPLPASHLLTNIVFSALALALFYFLSRPAFK
jgi:hypothetical protein